jgi:hypothetical protein
LRKTYEQSLADALAASALRTQEAMKQGSEPAA